MSDQHVPARGGCRIVASRFLKTPALGVAHVNGCDPATCAAAAHLERGGGVSNPDKWDAYQVCQQRGHTPSEYKLISDPPWNVCCYCGTHYRTETQLIEQNAPVSPVRENEG